MSRSIACFLSFLLAASCISAQQPKYDIQAPPLTFELLQAPSGTKVTWESLKGEAVVLNFWATWCAGCVAEIPRLNAIAEKFQDRPVRFIYISDEDKDTVAHFLPKRPILGWVALDKSGDAFRAFGVEGRPLTAFVDAQGILRGETNVEVTEADVARLLDGSLKMTRPADSEIPTMGAERNAPLPLFGVLIRPAMSVAETGMSPGFTRERGNVWEAWGFSLRRILSYSYSISASRILLPDTYEKANYDVSVTLPDSGDDSRRRILKEVIGSAFGIKAQITKRESDVYVLRRHTHSGSRLTEYSNGRTVGSIVSLAEQVLGLPVVDETGLDKKYDFVLALPNNKAELMDSVQRLDLELVPERRSIDILVADPLTSVFVPNP